MQLEQIKFKIATVAAIFIIMLGSHPPIVMAQDNQCQIARSAISEASTIRGLSIKSKVPCVVQEREQVKKYLVDTINTKIPKLKLRMEAFVFKALGLLPESFDYENGLVEMYLNQIGGYYDPESKRFAMAGWLPGVLQTTIAVHELTHALQDQYFNLKEFTDEKKYSGDELLARSALVEGDATAVMIDYSRRLMGQPTIASDENVETIMMQNVIGVSAAPGMENIPRALQMLMIFPYTSGLRFAHYGIKKNGYAELNKFYKRAPRSTEEILHPEKYYIQQPDFIVIDPASIKVPGLPANLMPIYQDVLGEFATSILLGNFVDDKLRATEAAAGWGGDRVVVFEDQNSKQQILVWQTNWDTENDAIQFETVLRLRLAKLQEPGYLSNQLDRQARAVRLEIRRAL